MKRIKQLKRKAQIQHCKKNPSKENSNPTCKKEKQDYSDQIPHRREFTSKAEMVDTTGQKNTTLVSSVLSCDEEKFSVDNVYNTNTVSTSMIIKQTKEYNRSDTWRTGRLSQNRVRDLQGIFVFIVLL